MRGGHLHERLLLDPLEKAFQRYGATVTRQARSRPGPGGGYVDLLVVWGRNCLAVEVETTPRRVGNDLKKAADLGAWLWVVVSNRTVAAGVRRHLKRLGVRICEPWICVWTTPEVLQQVANCCSIVVPVIDQKTKNKKSMDDPPVLNGF